MMEDGQYDYKPGERDKLRDHFATMALSVALEKGIVAADRNRAILGLGRDCYAIANSMLAAREAK